MEPCICEVCGNVFLVPASVPAQSIIVVRCPFCGNSKVPKRICPNCGRIGRPKVERFAIFRVMFGRVPRIKCTHCGFRGYVNDFKLVLPIKKDRTFLKFLWVIILIIIGSVIIEIFSKL